MDEPKAIQYQPKPLPAHRLPGASNLCTPLPGVVLRVCVQSGQTVQSGDLVAVVEAMKMENEMRAAYSGKVQSVLVRAGEVVRAGAVLAQFMTEEEP